MGRPTHERPVLAYVEDGPGGGAAARVAGALAGRLRSRLVLATIEPALRELPGGFDPTPWQRRHGRGLLEQTAREIGGFAELQVTFGEPVEQLLEIARRERAEFIVVGAPARSFLKELLLGSVYLALVSGAPCPVVVVPPRVEGLLSARGPIVAGVNGPTQSFSVARLGAQLAARLETRLELVCVARPLSPVRPGVGAGYGAVLVAQRDAAMRRLMAIAGRLPAGLDVGLSVDHGRPAERLSEFASRGSAQFVVTGFHDRGSISSLLLQSVPSRLATAGMQPLVILPPSRRDPKRGPRRMAVTTGAV